MQYGTISYPHVSLGDIDHLGAIGLIRTWPRTLLENAPLLVGRFVGRAIDHHDMSLANEALGQLDNYAGAGLGHSSAPLRFQLLQPPP
jgi:hypothetical protein